VKLADREKIDLAALQEVLETVDTSIADARKREGKIDCREAVMGIERSVGTLWNKLHPGDLAAMPAATAPFVTKIYAGATPFYETNDVQRAYDLTKDHNLCDAPKLGAQLDMLQRDIGLIHLDPNKTFEAVKRDRIEDVETYIVALHQPINTRRLAKQKALNEIEAHLSTENRTQSVLLIVALPMMGAVALLYLITMRFPGPMQDKLIERRTLVELVGIAFVLLVIMVLGAAGKLQETVLGTLLGSIASYIFGQQVARRAEAKETAPEKPANAPPPDPREAPRAETPRPIAQPGE
jgi:hypothetical protein